MKYNITLVETTTFTRYATVTVEADNPMAAKELARDLDDDGRVKYPKEPDGYDVEVYVDNVEEAAA